MDRNKCTNDTCKAGNTTDLADIDSLRRPSNLVNDPDVLARRLCPTDRTCSPWRSAILSEAPETYSPSQLEASRVQLG